MLCFALRASALAGGALALATASLAQYSGSQPVTPEDRPGFEAIQQAEIANWIDLLAGEEFAGRGTGQSGYMKSAYWLAGKFVEYGLQPAGDYNGFFQYMPFRTREIDPERTFLETDSGFRISPGANLALAGNEDMWRAEAPVVFISAASNEQEFPSDLDIQDKIVIADLAGAPQLARAVARSSAAIVLHVADNPSYDQVAVPASRSFSRYLLGGEISRSAATRLLDNLGMDPAYADSGPIDMIQVTESTESAAFQIATQTTETFVPNVVAVLPGSDPELSDEYVVLGAHLDHMGDRGYAYYPGADDNASGVAAMLGVAKALSESETKPRRSVLFIGFGAEEIGLIGSRYLVENEVLPVERLAALVNIDMIGRNESSDSESADDNDDTIHLVGTKPGEAFNDIYEAANAFVNFRFEYDEDRMMFRSDHAPFIRAGVPSVFMFAGLNPYYHTPQDTVEGINYAKVTNAAKLNYLVVKRLANDAERLPPPASN
jgi:hypothetical protein